MRSKGLDNERIVNLAYLYGNTSLYTDIIEICVSKNDVRSTQDIDYNKHVKPAKPSIPFLKRHKSGHTFKVPNIDKVSVRYEKKLIHNFKSKVEFHFFANNLFYIHIAFSDLHETEKKKMARHYANKYLDEGVDFDFETQNIVDSKGQIISFSNTFNYSINDFSVDFVIDKSMFPIV